MPVPLTITALIAAVILLFVNDLASAGAVIFALGNQTLVELSRATSREPAAYVEGADDGPR